jgi:hypothetical protein
MTYMSCNSTSGHIRSKPKLPMPSQSLNSNDLVLNQLPRAGFSSIIVGNWFAVIEVGLQRRPERFSILGMEITTDGQPRLQYNPG